MVIARDIHEQKQAEEELQRYREELARTERLASLGTLSATLAHELTQPLTVIRLSIQNSLANLKDDYSQQAIEEDLKEALDSISNAITIIERFRNFARKSTGRTISQVNLATISKKIVQLLNESARQAKVSINLQGLDKLPVIHGYERDIEQLFFTLVENSIQAADGKKSRNITISGTVKNTDIELQFSDDCGGIAPEHLDEIFEPFFTTKPAGYGTGLGLSIVQRIVSECDGHVRVENKYGQGCIFFVTLPIR
jgi:two-component system C4-dicarboxylate transport sensor histidine kinase DctB